eukprot:scaffold39986_cov29-Attheya_sp.AAC.1
MALNQHVRSDDNEDQDRGNILYENVQESTKEEILEQMRKPAIVGNMEAKRRQKGAFHHLVQSFASVIGDAEKAKVKTKYTAKELADIIYEFGVIFG